MNKSTTKLGTSMKIGKEIDALNHTFYQPNQINMYRIFHIIQQNTSILFKYIWEFHQDRPDSGS